MAKKMKVTYVTMSADNEELQSAYDQAIKTVEAEWLGAEVPMFINGEKVYTDEKMVSYSPVDTDVVMCHAQKGGAEHVEQAIDAAQAAFPGWSDTSWQERVALTRKAADNLSEASFEISAMMLQEVGKSRLEALGEVEEAVDLIRWYADQMEENKGYVREMGKLDPNDPGEHNFSVLLPYGVWAVISPFNFPIALSVAPIAAALVTGNTVIFKGSSDTLYNGWKAAEIFIDAGFPPGVFNYVSGPGRTVGQAIQDSARIDGFTFTGSYDVGMNVFKVGGEGPYPRPAIIEMGGKNPAIVSNTADLQKAATGVMRAAFGLDGQKCSACSRVYVHADVYDEFKAKLVEMTKAIKVGHPNERDTFMGTVINKKACDGYLSFMDMARKDGTILTGGNRLTDGDFSKGYFVEPAIIEGLAEDHELVKTELFLPILHLAKAESLDDAMAKANDTLYGLTAGFFGEEADWFMNNIQAGTLYVNRAAGATTGAWPGVQSFGGWKGSGSTGKAIGALYTLPLYMHEQSRTIID